MLVLVVNVGSSSLKCAVFDVSAGGERRVFAATLTSRAGREVAAVSSDETSVVREELIDAASTGSGVAWLLARLERDGLSGRLAAVGHRLVHGGARYRKPVWLEPDVMVDLRTLVALAPEHLPIELEVVDAVARHLPRVRQAGCFDTGFHRDLPARAQLFGLPRDITDSGVIRYGFHGLSYEYVVSELRTAGALGRRTVVAHLGSGASLAAVRDGQGIDTTMGFTPTGGIVMATRSGDLDPGVLLYLARVHGLTADALNRVVNLNGGLAGISGTTGDIRELLDRSPTDSRAAQAVDIFCYDVRKAIAALAAALGGLDSIVFTGGIGEHGAIVRARVCEELGWCGVALDAARNAAHAAVISAPESSVTVRIVPTNEELMIARHIRALLG